MFVHPPGTAFGHESLGTRAVQTYCTNLYQLSTVPSLGIRIKWLVGLSLPSTMIETVTEMGGSDVVSVSHEGQLLTIHQLIAVSNKHHEPSL